MKSKIISDVSNQAFINRLQQNINYFLSERSDRKQLLSLRQYEVRLKGYLGRYFSNSDSQKLAAGLRKLVDSLDLGIKLKEEKFNSPVRVQLPSSYRYDFNFPVSITEDIVQGRIVLKLRSGEDYQSMIDSFKGYLINLVNKQLEERLIGDRAAEMILDARRLQLIVPQLNVFKSNIINDESMMPPAMKTMQAAKRSLQELGELYRALSSQDLDKLGWGFQKLTYLHFNYQNNKQAFEMFVLPEQRPVGLIIKDSFKPLQDMNYFWQQLNKKVLASYWQKTIKNCGVTIGAWKQLKPLYLEKINKAGSLILEKGKTIISYFKIASTQLAKKAEQIYQKAVKNISSIVDYFKQISLAGYQKKMQRILMTMPLVLISFLLAGDKLEDKVEQPDLLKITELSNFEDLQDRLPEVPDITIEQVGLLSTSVVPQVLPDKEARIDEQFVIENSGLVSGLYYYEDSQLNFLNNLNLTFDDGPNLEKITVSVSGMDVQKTVTGHILDVLKQNNVKATFFINGKNFNPENPEQYQEQRRLLERMITEGHLIANHTFHHDNLSRGIYNDGIDDDVQQIKQEIELNQQALDEILGYRYPMKYFRPPYAEAGRNNKVDKAVTELGMKMIILQIDSFDYLNAQNSKWDERAILSSLSSDIADSTGGTILMHDLPITANLLEQSLRKISELENAQGGFMMASLSDLMQIKAENYVQISAVKNATIDSN